MNRTTALQTHFLRQVSERCATKTRLLIFTLVDTEKVRRGYPYCIRLGNGKKISDEEQKCVSLPSSLLNEDRSGKVFYLHIRSNKLSISLLLTTTTKSKNPPAWTRWNLTEQSHHHVHPPPAQAKPSAESASILEQPSISHSTYYLQTCVAVAYVARRRRERE